MRIILLILIIGFFVAPQTEYIRDKFISDFKMAVTDILTKVELIQQKEEIHNVIEFIEKNSSREAKDPSFEEIEAIPVSKNENVTSLKHGNFSMGEEVAEERSTLYDQILKAIQKYETKVTLDTTDGKEVFATFERVLREHPEIFYIESGSKYSFDGLGTLKWQLAYSTDQIKKMEKELEQKAAEFLLTIAHENNSDLQKVKAIHDYVVNETQYDYENFKVNRIPHESYTSYGALILGKAVCEGYTEAIQLLLNAAGIKNQYVVGKSRNQNHAWNLVQVDEEWYFLDATWNDPITQDGSEMLRYQYFLVDEKTLARDHRWDQAAYPKAVSTKYGYLHDISDTYEADGYLFFTSEEDDRLYKMTLEGQDKTRLTEERAMYPVVLGDWVYFSNYSYNGYLFKIKKDGSELQRVNDFHTIELVAQEGNLYFKAKETGKIYQLKE